MSEDYRFREPDLLKEVASLPVLSSGFRSRVLAAALEAQDRRAQGRRVLASSLGLFALLAGVAWMGPFSIIPSLENSESEGQISRAFSARLNGKLVDPELVGCELQNGDARHGNAGAGIAGSRAVDNRAFKRAATAPSALSSLHRGQVLMSVTGDDWQSVEEQLQSRQEHFPRFQM